MADRQIEEVLAMMMSLAEHQNKDRKSLMRTSNDRTTFLNSISGNLQDLEDDQRASDVLNDSQDRVEDEDDETAFR